MYVIKFLFFLFFNQNHYLKYSSRQQDNIKIYQKKGMMELSGFIRQRMETIARILEARELTLWYDQNWQKNSLDEKLHHSLERILTSSRTY